MIYIVIPVYNRKDFTIKCLDSLLNQSYTNFKIIVVDDGSTDGTQEIIKNRFKEVILLETPGNLFWTGTTNIGIKYALEHGAEFVMTLNNDTVASPTFIEMMVSGTVLAPNSLIGALAIDINSNIPKFCGERLSWWYHKSVSLIDSIKLDQKDRMVKVTHFPGRGLLIPKKVFDKIGLFDQLVFPHYFADYDFTYRAFRRKFKIYCNLDARLFIYPEESGDRELRKKKNFHSFYSHLSSIKGGGNLRNFFNFTIRNCPPHLVLTNLLVGFARRLIGFWIK